MNSGRSSRRLRPSADDDDGRNTSAGSNANEQSEHDMVAETLPRSHAARSSSRAHPPSHPGRAVALKRSAEFDDTMDTEQLSSLSSSSASSSSSKKSIRHGDMPSPGLSPIRRKGSRDATNQSSAPVPHGLVALPVVTKSTRRQTFASAKAPTKKEKKVLPLGEGSPQSSTSSSNEKNIMDLFAPPQSDRTRSRQSSALAPNPHATKPSSSKTEVVPGGRSHRKAQDPPSSPPPPSMGGKPRSSPKTPLEPKSAAERKVMSTTNRKQHGSATLVHIPQSSNDFDPFATFHKSPTWEIDAMQKSTESAPARMPVSSLFEVIIC